ncbi:unnamed protein product [Euphydryas editha]|uniref:Uncharacterized protein n=1 Tax=Euphydryas editha TaxID=104508 RepID=A0AAU9V1S5_EUPED|nr:unnamed protein product [Euphydryas editha]
MSLAKTCHHLETLTFDMKKILPLPGCTSNIVFFFFLQLPLELYNCGVHSGKTGTGFCYNYVGGRYSREGRSGSQILQNDSDFSDIESALKTHKRLHTPQDYIDVMNSCRKRNKLTAIKVEKNEFVGVSKMMKTIVNRKKDIEGNAVSWLKTKEI